MPLIVLANFVPMLITADQTNLVVAVLKLLVVNVLNLVLLEHLVNANTIAEEDCN